MPTRFALGMLLVALKFTWHNRIVFLISPSDASSNLRSKYKDSEEFKRLVKCLEENCSEQYKQVTKYKEWSDSPKSDAAKAWALWATSRGMKRAENGECGKPKETLMIMDLCPLADEHRHHNRQMSEKRSVWKFMRETSGYSKTLDKLGQNFGRKVSNANCEQV